MMTLNKIKITNARKWDVAKYDHFISKGANEFNENLRARGLQPQSSSTYCKKTGSLITSLKQNLKENTQRLLLQKDEKLAEQQIINEDVKISDFAYSKF